MRWRLYKLIWVELLELSDLPEEIRIPKTGWESKRCISSVNDVNLLTPNQTYHISITVIQGKTGKFDFLRSNEEKGVAIRMILNGHK